MQELAGKGLCAVVEGIQVCAGNEKLMDEIGVTAGECREPGTAVHLVIDGSYAGYLVVSDEIKETAAEDLQALKAAGVAKTVMLTGDIESVARAVGEQLAIDELHAQLLPDQKVECVEALLAREEGVLAFVGDGINDAPVLTRADIGIAMGALGSDAAIEAADIVLMDDQLGKIAEAIRISRKTMGIVRQNIIFSLSVKGSVLLLSALGITGMGLAVFADVGVMVIAILNAMRALK